MKLFLRNSNACDHNPPTLQTDRRTDRQLIMAIPRYATLRAVIINWRNDHITPTLCDTLTACIQCCLDDIGLHVRLHLWPISNVLFPVHRSSPSPLATGFAQLTARRSYCATQPDCALWSAQIPCHGSKDLEHAESREQFKSSLNTWLFVQARLFTGGVSPRTTSFNGAIQILYLI